MNQILLHWEEQVAKQILSVQLPSYKIEAQLIQFDGIPQLREKVEDIMVSEETFIGSIEENKLIGFVSYTETTELIDICRMVVHPDFFRRGIASSLLKHVLALKKENQQVVVCTGAKNVPAIHLYERFGFIKARDIEVESNFYITELTYR